MSSSNGNDGNRSASPYKSFVDINSDATESTRLLANNVSQTSLIEGGPRSADAAEHRWDGLDDFDGLPWWRRPSVYWLLFPYGVFTLAFGGVMVPKLNLILALVCQRYFADKNLSDPDSSFTPIHLGGENPQCRIPEVQSKVSTFLLVMSMITGLLSTVICPRMGHLSDRYGRTRLLAFASIGGLAAELITILAVKFPDVVDYRWLILGSVFDGLTGSFTAGGILAQSYTTDATPPSKRAVSLGFLSACLFMGLAFGPVLAAEFVKLTGSLLSIFYVALGCHTFFVLFVGFVIPDSLSKRRQKLARENWAKEWELRIESMGYWLATAQTINPFEPLRNLWPTGPGTSRRLRLNLAVLGSSEMVIMGTGFAAGACIILYSEYIFGWGNYESSQFVSALSISRVFVLVILSPIVNYFGRVRPAARQRRESGLAPSEKATGPDRLDFWILRASLVAELIGVIGYITAPDERFFFVCGMVTALGGLGAPTIQAAITKSIPADQTGRVLGAIGVLHSLARSLGPVLINGIYAATVKTFPQAFFVLLFVLFFLVLLASFVLKPSVHWEKEVEDEAEPLYPNGNPISPLPLDAEEPFIR